MKQLHFLTMYLLAFFISQAQPDSASGKKQKSFTAYVRTLDNKVIKRRLYGINDSQLVLLKSANYRQYIPVENIKSFSLRRKNSILKGALIGFGTGALAGIIMGLASGDDPVEEYPDPSNDPWGIGTFGTALNNAFALAAEEKALVGGIGMGASCAIIGTIIGAVAKKEIHHWRQKEKFRDLQAELMMKLVQK
jgi:hypothetical protein